ncbi:dehydrogenase [Tessaracoccus lapidicaptus]|uniref:Dehydrogenase n=1 Tax=Tessaracoccus lapidicaptus TaxID=1427523 RepID=A0A1C0AMA3_9ACTN|nr:MULTISPECIES: Gfo/Idh/MocA family oxidoreductase [Tessaracoccus]AQX17185.1 dehydrogenase [Tessaracoccus sp. T2.5-30]OCL33957.1 dehydrogenase [Tessaracoccus lapidicaptus]VEP39938.1 scyllo-inositol 2-dehydrogenase (NAD(+)) [Tessaracoccus lapidicaptus]
MAGLRAGLIGLGMMGRHHARNLRAIDGVDLVAVADPAGDPHGVAGALPVLGSVEELIAQGVDYVVVATPTAYHEQIGLALAEAGVHALIEKPLAKDTGAARRLAEAFAAKGLVGATGHIERYNPALQNLRKRLENGDLGDLYQVQTRRQGPFPSRIADVGVVKDLASHDVDLTAWVTQREYELVGARTVSKAGREYEDMVSATCQLSGGLMSNHLVNWLSPTKERLTVVTGEKGMFVADTLTADLTFYANGLVATTWDDIAQFRGVSEGDVTRFAIAKPEPLRTEHENFRDAVLGKDADIVTMEQGARVVEVCEAMIESAATNRFIEVGAA